MIDFRILEGRMSEERLKAQLSAAERECDSILTRFEYLGREPTVAERDARRLDFLATRKRMGELGNKLLTLRCSKL
jgi:hypothetical protein